RRSSDRCPSRPAGRAGSRRRDSGDDSSRSRRAARRARACDRRARPTTRPCRLSSRVRRRRLPTPPRSLRRPASSTPSAARSSEPNGGLTRPRLPSDRFYGLLTLHTLATIAAIFAPPGSTTVPTQPKIASPSGRVIAGLSAGGYGAFDIALHHPNVFGAVESWSGYFTPLHDGPFKHADDATLAANDPSLLAAREARRLRATGIRFF